MLEYKKSNIENARALRKNMTPWERKLWYEFLRSYPVRFQRQKAIDQYIVDFYCAKARLVIELDGGGHYEPEKIEADRRRSEVLAAYRLRVLRFSNADVDKNFCGVCAAIESAVNESFPLSGSCGCQTAPSSEGA